MSGGSNPRLVSSLQAQSPLFESGRALVIGSAYSINEKLASGAPGDQASHPRHFEPVDRRGFQQDPSDFAIAVAAGTVGGTRLSANVVKRGLAMVVKAPDESIYTFGFRRQGALRVEGTGRANEGEWGPGIGVLYRERPDMRVAISDEHMGLAFDLPRARIAAILGALTEREIADDFSFDAAFSLTEEPGASVARIAGFIEQELAIPGSLLSQSQSVNPLEDLLIRALLITQRHSYSHLLERAAPTAAPSSVRRAEAYMRAHAHLPLTLEMIAAAAGTSVRALQAAFQKFRQSSPLQELRKIRLELAHQEIQQQGYSVSLLDVALKYQFSNPGRFARMYKQTFGVLPSQARRRR
ncbi:AraC family transcriptional regulator [Acidiphilium sp. PA]|uniref:helix-turn-helix transcriptional regulator n=1 Tax=Acidiphilium sp. PA TaxID=2871705 RepID=UPI002243EE47|nr:AraC family transcriptional regulator [Acidiphilium sp. PA]MCW8309250.1 AraC family transcriptional regulator [Acidiphilium sp. PA]